MTNRFRFCPKHKKPLPCKHCEMIAQKPSQVPPVTIISQHKTDAVVVAEQELTPKTAAAIRAQRWREQRKQNPEFSVKEAKRKKQERGQKKLDPATWSKQDPVAWSERHPEFPLGLEKLRERDSRSNTYVTKAPRGKGKVILQGRSNGTWLERLDERMADSVAIPGEPTADPFDLPGKIPLRAQLSDAELIEKLNTIDDLQSKIDLILEHRKSDENFCEWLSNLSVDEVAKFIEYCSKDLEYTRDLLYAHTEHQERTKLMTWAKPQGRRVEPSGISDNHTDDLPRETRSTFANRISFKTADIEILEIGNRNVRFYNSQNGSVEEHFEDFVRDNVDPQPERDENGEVPDTPMMCQLCQREIAPGLIVGCVLAARFSVESGREHFGTEHRQEVIDHIRNWEAKAWRPIRRVCDRDHAALIARYGSGTEKVYCNCGKLLYKPAKPKRSDAPKEPLVGLLDAA